MSTTESSAPPPTLDQDEMSVTETATVPTILRRDADKRLMLVTGRANPELAARIANKLGVDEGVVDAALGGAGVLLEARLIWHWIDSHIRYAYEDEYGTIPSFSEKCLRVGKGDCGLAHHLRHHGRSRDELGPQRGEESEDQRDRRARGLARDGDLGSDLELGVETGRVLLEDRGRRRRRREPQAARRRRHRIDDGVPHVVGRDQQRRPGCVPLL